MHAESATAAIPITRHRAYATDLFGHLAVHRAQFACFTLSDGQLQLLRQETSSVVHRRPPAALSVKTTPSVPCNTLIGPVFNRVLPQLSSPALWYLSSLPDVVSCKLDHFRQGVVNHDYSTSPRNCSLFGTGCVLQYGLQFFEGWSTTLPQVQWRVRLL